MSGDVNVVMGHAYKTVYPFHLEQARP